MGWQWHQLDNMQIIYTSLQTESHASTSSLSFYRLDALPTTQPTSSKHWRHLLTSHVMLCHLAVVASQWLAAWISQWRPTPSVSHRVVCTEKNKWLGGTQCTSAHSRTAIFQINWAYGHTFNSANFSSIKCLLCPRPSVNISRARETRKNLIICEDLPYQLPYELWAINGWLLQTAVIKMSGDEDAGARN